MRPIDQWTGIAARALRRALRMSVRVYAEHLGVSFRAVVDWEARGAGICRRPDTQAILDTALAQAGDEVRARFELILRSAGYQEDATDRRDATKLLGEEVSAVPATDNDFDAELLELVRRAEASDVGATALDAVDLAVADLALRYPRTPPVELLAAIRRWSRDVVTLLDGKTTLAQRRRLLVAGGWLSLLAATVHVDLGHRAAAQIARNTAASLGREAEESELEAWAVETAAWEALVARRWAEALSLARTGQEIAPRSRAAIVQLTAQEARATARLGDTRAVYAALALTDKRLREQPDGQDSLHHFVFDPAKLVYYTATALSWLGDPAAEDYSREVLSASRAPRRVVTARIDLGLVLTELGRPDEAAALGAEALGSGWLVPSNVWRAGELVAALTTRYPDIAESRDLGEQLRTAARQTEAWHTMK